MTDVAQEHDRMPTADEATRFIKSNPKTSMNILADTMERPKDDEWAAGFAACLYLFTGRYADYARERDLHFGGA